MASDVGQDDSAPPVPPCPTRGRWRALIARVVVATLIAWILATAPMPVIPFYKWVAYVQVPVVIFLLICYIGKLLVDTFFYNHYKP